ncbi:serine hydrolase domain-containing protein [Muriicola sp. Z0-33]|uniref:serine hydrolase domain-containing protein n=1 Tax=Muriicola sp. Z0-33 TaxID=2816957 RepID=UPI0022384467|nr:serine hydrolase [Muriicola sp. Z0-33]MCW5515206.1 serine hydrolase [Muriicola sp. Z0-33]
MKKKKLIKRAILTILLLFIGIATYNYPKLNIISGYAAKNMASSVFMAARSQQSIEENDNNVPLIKLAKTSVYPEQHKASATVFGLMKRQANYREGLGCVLVNDDYVADATYLTPQRFHLASDLPFPYGSGPAKDSVFANIDYNLLHKTIDKAFSQPDVQKTRTVLIAYKDHIIAENYLEGFTKDTPILGWSMTKSVLATCYGILEYQKRLNVKTYKPFVIHKLDEDSGSDSKKEITLNHLLRMQSGLEWDEDYSRISDVTRMLFLDEDMTIGQGKKPMIGAPGEIWNYSSGTSNFLSGILRKEFKTYQEYLDFPYGELIDKIGMNSMLIEADMSGNYVGSSYGWASTRDWAKFGLLYLHKGDWNGNRIFAPEWVDYVSKPTALSDGTYGAHFWLNAEGKYPGVPKDLFSANGYQGQYVFIIPSKDLVIVRTGLAEPPDFDLNAFLKGIVDAID